MNERSSSQESLSSVGWRPLSIVNGNGPNGPNGEVIALQEVTQKPVETGSDSTVDRLKNAQHSFSCSKSSEHVHKYIDQQYRTIDEFRTVTYTPVLCEPEDFASGDGGYSLRQNRMKRQTELLIAITMYNESDEFLVRTLNAVFRNIRYFCELHRPVTGSVSTTAINNDRPQSAVNVADLPVSFDADGVSYVSANGKSSSNPRLSSVDMSNVASLQWNEHAWQKIVVCIIADGRSKIHPRVKKMLHAMGVFQEELIAPQFSEPAPDDHIVGDATAHLFETTCQTIIDSDLQIKSGFKQGIVPVQMLFCLKEKNAKKLNSHKWLFRAVAPLLNPRVCVLIDVGTRPKTPDAIYNLWNAFAKNPKIAGAAGEICVMTGKNCTAVKSILQPLVASQLFEYQMSNILDKTLESCFGYISVLPGAFSAYRWEALQDSDPETGPLISYFKGETPKPKGNVFSSNMYLAEDRILCFELVAKKNCNWILHFVKDAMAETDVPSTVPEFISQRRRWLNGTFFCQLFALWNIDRVWSTKHSFKRKLALTIQALYSFASLIFSWFNLANFYLAFYLLTTQTFNDSTSFSTASQGVLFYILRTIYLCIMVAVFICSMGNRPQGAESIFVGSMVLFGLIMLFMIVITGILIYQSFLRLPADQNWFLAGGTSRDILISMISTYGVYFASSLIYGKSLHIISSICQYLLLLPSYINTVSIYAFCNAHDISWGTKGDNNTTSNMTLKRGAKKDVVVDMSPTSYHIPRLTNENLDRTYKSALTQIRTPPNAELNTVDPSIAREDYYKNFRTWFVLFWVMTNGLLIVIVSSPEVSLMLTGNGNVNFSNPYMQFIMYSIAAFALIRFFGCITYMLLRLKRHY